MDTFFITLPSTASSHLYPNTQSHYRVHLPQPMELIGDWVVGLSEIHVPILYDNIDETSNTFHLHTDESARQETRIDIPGFSFEGIDRGPYLSLISHVADHIPKELRPIIPLTQQQKKKIGYDITFSNELTDLLGLRADNSFMEIPRTASVSGKHTLTHSGNGLWIQISHPATSTFIRHRLVIPHGLYTKTHHLLQAMSDALPKSHSESVIFKENRDGTITILCKQGTKVKFPSNNHGLGTLLGFEDQKAALAKEARGIFPVDMRRGVYGLYVYSDLIQPHMVGDTFAPLLRVIPIQEDDKYAASYVKIYTSPDYYPLMQNRFETIEIDIRTDYGQRLKFRNGKTLVKLSFKKV